MNAQSKLTDLFAFGWPCVIIIILSWKIRLGPTVRARTHIRGNIKNRIPVQSYGNISPLIGFTGCHCVMCACARVCLRVHVVRLIWGLSLMGWCLTSLSVAYVYFCAFVHIPTVFQCNTIDDLTEEQKYALCCKKKLNNYSFIISENTLRRTLIIA